MNDLSNVEVIGAVILWLAVCVAGFYVNKAARDQWHKF